MTDEHLDTAARFSLFASAVSGIGSGLMSLARLPWYSAIGFGMIVAFVVFFFFAVLFSIEV